MKTLIVTTLFFIGSSPILATNRIRRAGGYSQGGSSDYGGDMSAIPGNPGQDYPIYGPYPPASSFRCAQQPWLPGYYADTQTRCQGFHICEKGGRGSMFLCPNGTLFNQKYFVCDWWYNVNCGDAPNQYGLNGNLYRNVPAVAGYQGSSSSGRAVGGGGGAGSSSSQGGGGSSSNQGGGGAGGGQYGTSGGDGGGFGSRQSSGYGGTGGAGATKARY